MFGVSVTVTLFMIMSMTMVGHKGLLLSKTLNLLIGVCLIIIDHALKST